MPCPVKVSSKQWQRISFRNCIFLPKGGGTQAILLDAICMGSFLGSVYSLLHTYSCLIGTLSSKGCNPSVVKVVGSLDQGPATEIIHLGLNLAFPILIFGLCSQ